MLIDETRVYEFLQSLGSTSDEVHNTLVNKNIKGSHTAARCPIANALYQQFSIDAFVSDAEALLTHRFSTYEEVYVLNPTPVRDFVRAFDANKYPDLEEVSNGA